jgi:hypothetical protein
MAVLSVRRGGPIDRTPTVVRAARRAGPTGRLELLRGDPEPK